MTALSITLPVLKETFDQQGYVILERFFAADQIEQARQAMQELVERQAQKLLAEGKINDPLKAEPFETRLMRLYASCMEDVPRLFRPELHLSGLFPLFFHPQLLDIVEIFLGPEIRLYPNYSARPKLPDHPGTRVLWHQDGGYTHTGGTHEGDVEQLRMVNVWTPLVPATEENGCMQFIPGTHKLGVVPHESKEYYLEIDQTTLAPLLSRAISIEISPGDLVLFHNLLFHQGMPNRSQTIRWSLDWRYQDATQPTLREHNGHIARSRSHPERAVQSAEDWARLTFS